MPLSFLTNDALRLLGTGETEMRKAADHKETTVAELLREAYTETKKEEESVEIVIDYDEAEQILREPSKQEEVVNTEKDLGKVKAKKHSKFRLKPFPKSKGKEKGFHNEGPSKESIDFQKLVMEEVVKGKQMQLFTMNPVFPKRPEAVRFSAWNEALKRLASRQTPTKAVIINSKPSKRMTQSNSLVFKGVPGD